jgi:hypothetical protein
MALTDVFFRRYTKDLVKGGRRLPPGYQSFFSQVAHIIVHDVQPRVQSPGLFLRVVHDKLAREMSIPRLARGESEVEVVLRFLTESSDWEREMSPDIYVKTRLSLLEILLAELEKLFPQPEPGRSDLTPVPTVEYTMPAGARRAFVWSDSVQPLRDAIREVNERFRLNGLGFHYHSGVIQESGDHLTTTAIEDPFWSLLSGVKWNSVNHDMKEALDHRDSGRGDASFHALKALESAIKILSDDRRLTTGRERGAVNYIENLASSRANGFLAPWEAEHLKLLFSSVRNPQGHGAGAAQPLALRPEQTDFLVESSMSWIKSLVTRG